MSGESSLQSGTLPGFNRFLEHEQVVAQMFNGNNKPYYVMELAMVCWPMIPQQTPK